MDCRSQEQETPETQARILDICPPCQWSWSTCPNTGCVMNIRQGRTQNLWRVLGSKLQ